MEKTFHLAIICDGNRRWARAQGLRAWDGHRRAIEQFRGIAEWCCRHPRIGTLTLWGFSTENWKRDPLEVRELMRLFETFMTRELPWMIENSVRFVHAGRIDRIPASLALLFRTAAEQTKDFTDFTLQLAIDYGGKDEVVRAVRKMAPGEEVTEASIRAHLDHPEVPDIDLVIRTSGEQRTSNFFLWHAAYAEWMFPPVHFPDLTVDHLAEALLAFDQRKRRFGS